MKKKFMISIIRQTMLGIFLSITSMHLLSIFNSFNLVGQIIGAINLIILIRGFAPLFLDSYKRGIKKHIIWTTHQQLIVIGIGLILTFLTVLGLFWNIILSILEPLKLMCYILIIIFR